jgi:LacI family transcriptional regulator
MTTIHDVAKRAGVSPVTVSRVINDAGNVNAATRARVEGAIAELGYVPNLSARSLRSRQTATLALIVPDITNAFWTTVARGVEDTAQAEGYSVLLCNTDENLAKQTGYINAVLQQRVDGVILAPYDSDPHNLRQLGSLKTPVVILDRLVAGLEVDSVRTDSVSGAFALTQHLVSLGHRQIAMISGPSVTSTAEERVAGYCLALEEAGLPLDPRLVRRGEYRTASGRLLTDQLFQEGLDPTAIIAANNLVAMGVLESLQNHGKTVPQDIALVCFDELPDLARFYPFLTVVVQPAYDMGVNAAQLLLSRIEANVPLHPRHVILPSRLVLRYSCGRFLRRADSSVVENATATLTPLKDHSESILVRPLANVDEDRLAHYLPGYRAASPAPGQPWTGLDQPDASRLARVLLRREKGPAGTDRLPHVEARITSRALLEYVLQRSLPYSHADLESGRQTIAPLDYIEFARRVGLDAVPCEISWRPGPLPMDWMPETLHDFPARLTQAFPPPSLTETINRLEGYLRAAQGTGISVYLSISGFFSPAMHAANLTNSQELTAPQRQLLERLMDLLMAHQEKTLRAICDRFSADLAFAVIRDDLMNFPGVTVQSELFQTAILPRLFRLSAPIREHSLLTGLNSGGSLAEALPVLYKHGFGIIQSLDPACNDFTALLAAWRSRITFMGGLPVEYLLTSARDSLPGKVREYCQPISNGGGLVLGAAGDLTAEVRPELFLAFSQALYQM